MKQRRAEIPHVAAPSINWQNKVGTGRFGTGMHVYMISHDQLDEDEVYAAKHCRFERTDAEATFNRELEILSLCQCPYIIRLYATYDFAEGSAIGRGFILEYAERSLGSFLHDKPLNKENEKYYHLGHVIRWMKCAAEGLLYIHNMDIIHRDVKPENCLLFDYGTTLKLADFGVTRQQEAMMTSMAGSIIWMAPEVATSTVYTNAVDVYSWAIMFWECLTRKLPYYNCRYLRDAEESRHFTIYNILEMKQKQAPLPIDDLPFPIGLFLDECWSLDASKRPSMKQICKLMRQLEICCQEPTSIDISKTVVEYAPTESTVVRSGATVIKRASSNDCLDQQQQQKPSDYARKQLLQDHSNKKPSTKTRRQGHRRGDSADNFSWMAEDDRMAKSMEQMDRIRQTPPMRQKMIRRDVSGYSDTVFERPRSTHFELDDPLEDHAGCVTPIRSFLKSFWDDPGTDNYKLHTRPPMPDTACPESVELYKKGKE